MPALLDSPSCEQPARPEGVLLGRRHPRIGTEPLRPLTPQTSRGFEAAAFAREVLGEAPSPWQEELLVRALELLPDGRYRFRTVLCLVGRQQGKTWLLRTLALWRLYMDDARLVLSVAQSLDIAREAWRFGCESVEDVEELKAEHDKTSRVNGDEWLGLTGGRRWKISAANRSAGRGLSVDLLLMDEAREQRSWDAWAALSKTTIARRNGQTWVISNAGDDQSVVLNSLRESAISGKDESLGIFEWSAPDGCALDDREAWTYSCPGLGYTVDEAAIASALSTDPPARFRTELLCQKVDALDSPINPDSWRACADPAGSLDHLRDRVALCLDISPDGEHSTLMAAALESDGRVRLDTVAEWTTTDALRADLPGWVERIRPRVLGWFPGGPAAALAPYLRDIRVGQELRAGDVPSVCMAFADEVAAGRVLHGSDPMLTSQVLAATTMPVGDGWRFVRRGVGAVDAVYAAAGAAHLARTMPAAVGGLRVVVPRSVRQARAGL